MRNIHLHDLCILVWLLSMFYIQKMQQNSYWNALVAEVCTLRINFGIISIIKLPTNLDWCRAFASVRLNLRTLKNPGLSLNSSVSNYQNLNLTLRLRQYNKRTKLFILKTQCDLFFFLHAAPEPIMNFN